MTTTTLFEETWCGAESCQHPPCWQAQRRIIRGQPHPSGVNNNKTNFIDSSNAPSPHNELPTQKIYKLHLQEDDENDENATSLLPKTAAYSGANALFHYLQQRALHRLPTGSGASTHRRVNDAANAPGPVSQVNVQEISSVRESTKNESRGPLAGNAQYYVWMPKAKHRKTASASHSARDDSKALRRLHTQNITNEVEIHSPNLEAHRTLSSGTAFVERSSQVATSRNAKLFFQSARRPRPELSSPHLQTNTHLSSRFRDPTESSVDLLQLPPDVLTIVLDSIEKGELMTRRRIDELLTTSTHFQESVVSTRPDLRLFASELLQQRKLGLHMSASGERNLRQPERHQFKPVFRLDNDTRTDLPRTRTLPPIASTCKSVNNIVAITNIENVGVKVGRPTSLIQIYHDSTRRQHMPANKDLRLMLGPVDISNSVRSSVSSTPRTIDADNLSMQLTCSTDRSTLLDEVLPTLQATNIGLRYGRRHLTNTSSNDLFEQNKSRPDETSKEKIVVQNLPEDVTILDSSEEISPLISKSEDHQVVEQEESIPLPVSANISKSRQVTFQLDEAASPEPWPQFAPGQSTSDSAAHLLKDERLRLQIDVEIPKLSESAPLNSEAASQESSPPPPPPSPEPAGERKAKVGTIRTATMSPISESPIATTRSENDSNIASFPDPK